MYSDKDIRAAVEAGVMPKQTANAFRDFIQQQRGGVLNQDQEYIPLVHGFNDIFVVIAAVIVGLRTASSFLREVFSIISSNCL